MKVAKVAKVEEKVIPREHKCDQCEYRSSHRSGLTTHVRAVHDKIKSHACTECEFRWVQTETQRVGLLNLHAPYVSVTHH